MNQLITTNNGGFPFVLNDLRFDQQAVRDGFIGLLSSFGISIADSFILSGCNIVAGNYQPGWIFLGGEILKFNGSPVVVTTGYTAVWDVDVTYDAAGDKRMENGTTVQTYQVRNAKVLMVLDAAAVSYLTYANAPTWATKIINQVVLDTPALALATKIIAVIAAYNNPLITKVIDIGDWNMDTNSSVQVPHGISDVEKIRDVQVMIRTDAGYTSGAVGMIRLDSAESAYATGNLQGSIAGFDSVNLTLIRLTGGRFDGSAYDSTGYNRGFITIRYEP